MEHELTSALLFLGIGLLIGMLLAWLWLRLRLQATHISRDALQQDFIRLPVHRELQDQADALRADLQEKEAELRDLSGQLSAGRERIAHLTDQQQQWEAREAERSRKLQLEFEGLANRLLEEKSRRFAELNQKQMGDLLGPLRERIQTFEQGIRERFVEETRDRVSLKKEIEQLRQLNQQLSQDATNLTQALKGDAKTQGDWGEWQLERLLEQAGLQKEVHYRSQSSYADEGGRQKRPDYIIRLPEDKHLVLDAKVSLTAYERYCSSEEEAERARHLRAHLDSLRRHIRSLSEKNYQQLYQINSPDYLLLFVPLEPAFALAIREEPGLFNEALDRHIVLVTTSTLLATLRTVAFIWKQEKQKRNVLEIARQSGMLYDKFVAFVEDLQEVGRRLDQTHQAYDAAMHKLRDGKRYGDTLIGRAEKVKSLGAKASKQLPPELLDEPPASNGSDQV